jgi:hypothetical protein
MIFLYFHVFQIIGKIQFTFIVQDRDENADLPAGIKDGHRPGGVSGDYVMHRPVRVESQNGNEGHA